MPVSPTTAEDTDVRLTPGARGFAVYVHWPFCASKCPYCDFNSHVRETVDEAAWRDALLAEIDHTAAQLGPRTVGSIFFGGGTPSLMAVGTAAAVIERIAARWSLAADAEITLEANPTSAEAENFRSLAAAGVNRLSIGVQALDDDALRRLGRRHSAAEALHALEAAAAAVPRWSFDLIYGRPGQSRAAWQDELARALKLGADHMSLYQLTIEAGTAFHGAAARGELVLPDEDLAAALYEDTQAAMAAAGLPAYEISNHARPGERSRHNLVYWRYGEYVGIGPGAHGRPIIDAQRHMVARRRLPERWLAAVQANGFDYETNSILNRNDRAAELLMMGLRLSDGIDRADFTAEIGADPLDFLGAERIGQLRDLGLLRLDGHTLAATSAGRAVLNSLLAELLA